MVCQGTGHGGSMMSIGLSIKLRLTSYFSLNSGITINDLSRACRIGYVEGANVVWSIWMPTCARA